MQQSSYETLRPDLPEALSDLYELALDLRWSWSHVADELWRRMDEALWRETQNPWLILQVVSQARLRELERDEEFIALLQTLREEQLACCRNPGWLALPDEPSANPHIAYFCMEFGLSEALPIYSGGLGVLAGDHLKSACEAGLRLTAVGLLYQQGYFRQGLDSDGGQIEFFPYNDPTQLPIVPARDDDGEWLHVGVELPGRELLLRIWRVRVGRVDLLLLDSNSPLNMPADRGITAELYGGGPEIRLQQEMALGIGGVRALRAIGVDADVFHLNEGHAAFAVLERARLFMRQEKCSFDEALTATRAGNLFTTHTPVAAGFDRFPPELVRRYLGAWADAARLPIEPLLTLGGIDDGMNAREFNMAVLATRGSLAVNAVSRLHRKVSQKLFAGLYPRWPLIEVPVGHVTNGIHVPSWDSRRADALWTKYGGKDRWRGGMEDLADKIHAIEDHVLWEMRSANRRMLIEWIRRHHLQQTMEGSVNGLAETSQLLDPNILTIGFARRFASYKRPTLLLREGERLVRLIHDSERPVQLIIAGKAHPRDRAGKEMIHQWIHFIRDHGLHTRVVFLVDYDLELARRMVQGVDLWLNTPRRPWEASGTSGMKVLVNGGINLSALDGWWAEAYRPELGFAIGDGREHGPEHDAADAHALLDRLEFEVIPEFYERDEQGVPRQWVARMRASMAELTPRFSTTRMLGDYFSHYYFPLAAAWRQRAANGAQLARELVAWQGRIEAHWDSLHIGRIEMEAGEGALTVHAQVYLGEMRPEDVNIELYADPPPGLSAPEIYAMNREQPLSGAIRGFLYRASIRSERDPRDYSVRIVPHHRHAKTPMESQRILWASQ